MRLLLTLAAMALLAPAGAQAAYIGATPAALPTVISDGQTDWQINNSSAFAQVADKYHRSMFGGKIQLPCPDGSCADQTETVVPMMMYCGANICGNAQSWAAATALRVATPATPGFANCPTTKVRVNGRRLSVCIFLPSDPCAPNQNWTCTASSIPMPNKAVDDPNAPALGLRGIIDPYFLKLHGENWLFAQCGIDPQNPYQGTGLPEDGQNDDTSSCAAPFSASAFTGIDISRLTAIVTGVCVPNGRGDCQTEHGLTWTPDTGAAGFAINAATPKAALAAGTAYVFWDQARYLEPGKVWTDQRSRGMAIGLSACPGDALKTCLGRAGQATAWTTDSLDPAHNTEICDLGPGTLSQDCGIQGNWVDPAGNVVNFFNVGGQLAPNDPPCSSGSAEGFRCWNMSISRSSAPVGSVDAYGPNAHYINSHTLWWGASAYTSVVSDGAGGSFILCRCYPIQQTEMNDAVTLPPYPKYDLNYDVGQAGVVLVKVDPLSWTFD